MKFDLAVEYILGFPYAKYPVFWKNRSLSIKQPKLPQNVKSDEINGLRRILGFSIKADFIQRNETLYIKYNHRWAYENLLLLKSC